jgi:hypothetical protein
MDEVNMHNVYKNEIAKTFGPCGKRVGRLGQKAKNLRILPVETKIDEMPREMLRKLRKKVGTRGPILEVQMKAWASYVRTWVLEGI